MAMDSMLFFTSGCVWCFRSGHFGAGNAGRHKKPAEEGDRRGVGKGEAPTSRRTWTRARLPLLEMQVEVKSSGLINLSHVYHIFPGTEPNQEDRKDSPAGSASLGGETRAETKRKKKRKEKSNHQMGRSSRDWERPPSGGIEVGDVSGEGAPNSYPAPPGGTSVGSDVELRLAFSHLHFRASASCFKFH